MNFNLGFCLVGLVVYMCLMTSFLSSFDFIIIAEGSKFEGLEVNLIRVCTVFEL